MLVVENTLKLDKKDSKILYYLDINSRQTLSQLAKKVGLSKQAVDYRIRNLVSRGVVSQFYAVINFSKLGYTHYKLYLKFQNVNPEREKRIITYWVNSKSSIWVASCHGRWDMAVSLLCRDVNVLGDVLTDFLNKYAKFILEKNILITQISPIFTKTYLTEQKEKREFTLGGEIGRYKPDDVEKKILSVLAVDARTPLLNLMKRTALTRPVVSYRLKKLAKDNVISSYRVMINLNRIGYSLYKVLLRLQNLSSQKENEFSYFIKQHPNGVQFLRLLGSWDVELEFEVRDEEHLHRILMDVRNRFSDIIRDYDTLLIYREHKLNYFPFY